MDYKEGGKSDCCDGPQRQPGACRFELSLIGSIKIELMCAFEDAFEWFPDWEVF
ncbi:hypothetical protein [Pseudomonas xanthosomatis]|uniref:hypothetical protein n=1 Tax=Pseudomonas xanthosomatis TaxID=2842356 RepID=UPI003518635C